jgi:hypothetical protein
MSKEKFKFLYSKHTFLKTFMEYTYAKLLEKGKKLLTLSL